MGGARPKATVTRSGRLFLAKFPMKDHHFDNARVEMALSVLARDCGIETLTTDLISLPEVGSLIEGKRKRSCRIL